MSNAYYAPSGAPSTGASGASADIRAEFALIEAALDLLPVLSGNSEKLIAVNTGETSLTVANISINAGGDLTVAGDLVVSGAGPHAIGGAVDVDVGLKITPTFTGSTQSIGTFFNSALTGVVGGNIEIIRVGGTLIEAGSGTHTDVVGLRVEALDITNNAATTTNATSLKVDGAPTEGDKNYAFWVDSGATRLDGELEMRSPGPHTVGQSSTLDYVAWYHGGSFTSLGTGSVAYGNSVAVAITLHSGDTTRAAVANVQGAITLPSAITVGEVAALRLVEPNITLNGGTVTTAATLQIASAPTEATNNYALWVDSGAVKFDGTANVVGALTVNSNIVFATNNTFIQGTTTGAGTVSILGLNASDVVQIGDGTTDTRVARQFVVSGTGPHAIGGAALDHAQLYLTGSFASGGASTASAGLILATQLTGANGDTSWLSNVSIDGTITTQGNTETVTTVSSIRIVEPVITVGSGDTVTNAATVHIVSAPTEATNNYALWVDSGITRLDGATALFGGLAINSESPSASIDIYETATHPAIEWTDAGVKTVALGLDDGTSLFKLVDGAGAALATATTDDLLMVWNTSTGAVYMGDSANADISLGLTINQQDHDDQILALKSSDVAHGMTDQAETDTFGSLAKAQATSGGVALDGYKDADGSGGYAVRLRGKLGETSDTGKTTSAAGVVSVEAFITDGGTGLTDVGADGNLFVVRNNITTRFIFDTEGTMHTVGAASGINIQGTGDGSITTAGGLTVSGTGPHSIGGSLDATIRFIVQGNFTSDGSGTTALMNSFNDKLTPASGDTTYVSGTRFANTLTTQAAAEAIAVVSQVRIEEPFITIGTATVTASASLYIAAAATEATSNYAIWVDSGNTRLDGSLLAYGLGGNVIGQAAAVTFVGTLIGGTPSNPITGSSGIALNAAFTAAVSGTAAMVRVQGSGLTQAASGTHALMSGLEVQALQIQSGSATTTDGATLYVSDESTGATNNYALYIGGGGQSRFEGKVKLLNNATMHASADDLIIGDGVGTHGLTIYSGGAFNGSIYFADGDAAGTERYMGYMEYNHNTNQLLFGAGSGTAMYLTSTGMTVANDLVVSGTGPHAFGNTAQGYASFFIGGAYSSDGSATYVVGLFESQTLTAAAGDNAMYGFYGGAALTTQGASETLTTLAQMRLDEPQITVGSGDTVTNGTTLYISDAPTEATNNYAIWVDAGNTRLDGNLEVRGAGSHSIGGSSSDDWRLLLTGSFTSGGGGSTSSLLRLDGTLTGASGDTTALSGMLLAPSITTQGAAEAIGIVASMWVAEPNITIGTATVTSAASLYIPSGPTEATNNYALWVDAGDVRLDGSFWVAGNDAHAIGAGGTAQYVAFRFNQTFTSDGASNLTQGILVHQLITGASGDTSRLVGTEFVGTITTQTETESIADICTVLINEPVITDNLTGDITTATSLKVLNAPTEGETNYAFWVASGNVLFGGDLSITGTLDAPLTQNSQSAAYTTVLGDAGKHIFHPTADDNPRTFTIDANGTVAYPIGTAITFVNEINTVTIAITTDTMTLAGAGTTGSRTLAAMGMATALKVSATTWIISGVGLT